MSWGLVIALIAFGAFFGVVLGFIYRKYVWRLALRRTFMYGVGYMTGGPIVSFFTSTGDFKSTLLGSIVGGIICLFACRITWLYINRLPSNATVIN